MKKYIYAALGIGLIILLSLFLNLLPFNRNNDMISEIFITPTPTPLILPNGTINEIEFGNDKYLILSVKIPGNATVSLIPNFTEKYTGEKIIEDNNCQTGINGGFYLPDEKPLGLFYTQGQEINSSVSSNIANAYVISRNSGEIFFSRTNPDTYDDMNFIFQTGPLISPSNNPIRLKNDEKTRRSLLGLDQERNLYLITVTTKDNLVDGPYLSDIPVIFHDLKTANQSPIEELINLDGGSASFFHSKDSTRNLTLSSWSPVGSLLCVKYRE